MFLQTAVNLSSGSSSPQDCQASWIAWPQRWSHYDLLIHQKLLIQK